MTARELAKWSRNQGWFRSFSISYYPPSVYNHVDTEAASFVSL